MNRAVFVLAAILCLLSVSSITGLIRLAKADGGTITINADGSISPSTAPIYTADNVTYTFTANIINESIIVQRDNIVLNGAGYTVTGNESGVGITLTSMSNITVRNMTITNFDTGIYLYTSSNNALSGNNAADNWYGIYLDSSSNNVLSGNNVTANNFEGIYLVSSSNNTLSGNYAANNERGIYLDSSSNNTVSGNNLTANNVYGILLDSSSNDTLLDNNVTNNRDGIDLEYSSGNTLSGNNVTVNNDYGIWFYSSSNNLIFLNSFVNNTNQAYTDGLPNIWNNGSVGNYWSDYLTKYPNATQVDNSGVWNTPYNIDTSNTDHYPLMVPIVIVPEFPSIQATMLFMLLTLLAVIIYKKGSD